MRKWNKIFSIECHTIDIFIKGNCTNKQKENLKIVTTSQTSYILILYERIEFVFSTLNQKKSFQGFSIIRIRRFHLKIREREGEKKNHFNRVNSHWIVSRVMMIIRFSFFSNNKKNYFPYFLYMITFLISFEFYLFIHSFNRLNWIRKNQTCPIISY